MQTSTGLRPHPCGRIFLLAACASAVAAFAPAALAEVLTPRLSAQAARTADACPLEGPQWDDGSIVVIEHDGSDYSKLDPQGDLNLPPRTCTARRFYREHGDNYDFLVVVTNFEFVTGDALAFHVQVRNDVHGLGRPPLDVGALFGSPGRLKGYIDLAALSRYTSAPATFTPGTPGFRQALDTLAHEIAHQWLAYASYRDGGGAANAGLSGRDASHWSALLDSDASHLYGSDWEPIGPGRYRAERVRAGFSALDLYLMGLLAPQRVAPFTLLHSDDPGVQAGDLPLEGREIEATSESVALDAVIAQMGPRSPDVRHSQKEFRVGFVFLAAPGSVPTPDELLAVERLREAFTAAFFTQTRGAAVADTTLAEALPGPVAQAPDVAAALAWLLARQAADGRWQDAPPTAPRDTAAVLEALWQLGLGDAPYSAGVAWLAALAPANTDFTARQGAALAPRLDPAVRAERVRRLLALQNADGGFGAGEYASDALDSALVLRALRALGLPAGAGVRRAFALLGTWQDAQLGGWPHVRRGAPSTVVTAEILRAALDWPDVLEAQALVGPGLAALAARRNPDGGFGEGPSTPYATALALQALGRAGAASALVAPTLAWLQTHQRPDGSWNGSTYETALVLSALALGGAANLVVPADALSVEPAQVREGESVHVTARVRNSGCASAGASSVRLFEGDPALGHELAPGVSVPELAPGDEFPLGFDFSSTDLAGARTLYVVADADDQVQEAREDDNTASRALRVEGLLADLVVRPAGIQVSPDPPQRGETVQVVVNASNEGERASSPALLRLFVGDPRQGGRLLGQAQLAAIAAGASHAQAFAWDTTGLTGVQELHAVADAAFAVAESDETNNEGVLPVDVLDDLPGGPELQLVSLQAEPARLSTLPQEVQVHAVVRNRGLTGVAATSVALYDTDPPSGAPLAEQPVPGLAPRSTASVVFGYAAAGPGTRHFVAVADPYDVLPEDDETNNAGRALLVDPGDTVDLEIPPASVQLSSGDIVVGDVLTVTLRVRNRGTAPVVGVPVVLEHLDGSARAELARALVTLAPGEGTPLALDWTSSFSGDPVTLALRADPFDLLSEVSEENNEVPVQLRVRPSDRPNLVLRGADLALDPDPPGEGLPALVSALVRNAGSVDAGAFFVRFYRGDPDQGGTVIGGQALFALAAGAGATVSVTWPQVETAGPAGLFARADADEQIDEYDESDNTGFRPFAVIGRADLVLGAASVRLEPAFPHAGETVALHLMVRNLGGQAAAASVLEAHEGEGDAAPLIGSATLPQLLPGERFDTTLDWTPAGSGEFVLRFVADAAGAVAEADEGNNVARRVVIVQDADLYLTAPYFSPDGDGAQDETTLAWRVTGAPTVTLLVAGADGRALRTLREAAESSGSVAWDGRGDDGRLVADGSYAVLVLDAERRVLGRAEVVVDTNRAAIQQAAGSGLLLTRNLTCDLPGTAGVAWDPHEDRVFVLLDGLVPGYPAGLLRLDDEGGRADVARDPWYAGARFPSSRAVSPDGREVLVVRGGELVAVDLASASRRLVTSFGYHYPWAEWSPDGTLVATSVGLFTRQGSQVPGFPGGAWTWSPDGTWLSDGYTVIQRDGSDRRDVVLPDDLSGSIQWRWHPDGRLYVAVNDAENGSSARCAADCHLLINPETLAAQRLTWLDMLEASVAGWAPDGSVAYDRPRGAQVVTDVAQADGTAQRQLLTRLGADARGLEIAPHAGAALFAAAAGPSCSVPGGNDLHFVRNLLNLTAWLRAEPLPGRQGVSLVGTVADAHLESWQLEFASAAEPGTWHPIGPASDAPLLDDVLAVWVPPAPGGYVVRLSARDRAGNARERSVAVAWDGGSVLANVTQSEWIFSPDGDGVKDEVRFDYLVLEPTRVDVSIAGPVPEGVTAAPPVVRRFALQYPAVGAQAWAWDGRDEQGQLVADGRYDVRLNGLPLRIEVDTTPPDIALSFQDPRATLADGRPTLVADRAWHVVDAHLASWQAPFGTGTAQAYEPARDAQGEILYDHGVPRVLRVDGRAVDAHVPQKEVAFLAARSALTFAARDRAGNVSVVSVPPLAEDVVLTGASGGVPPRLVVEPADLTPGRVFALPLQTRFHLAETLRDTPPAGEQVRLEYQPRDGGTWSAAPPSSLSSEGSVDENLAGLGVALGAEYRGRFAADGRTGSVASQPFLFRLCEDAFTLELDSPVGSGARVGVQAREPIEQALFTGRDSTGAIARAADGRRLEALPMQPVAGGFALALSGNYCQAQVVLVGRSGRRYQNDGLCARLARSQCPALEFRQAFESDACRAGAPDSLRGVLSETAQGQWVRVTADPEGTPQPVAAFPATGVPGLPPVVHAFTVDVAGRPEGALALEAVTSASESGPAAGAPARAAFEIDRTAPRVIDLQPAEGARVCAQPAGATGHESLGLVLLVGDDHPVPAASAAGVRVDARPAGSAWRPLYPSPGAGDGPCSVLPPGVAGTSRWDVTDLPEGPLALRITLNDVAGNARALERNVVLQRRPPRVDLGPRSDPVFSPNGDGAADQTVAGFGLSQPATVSAVVHQGSAGGAPVRTLLADVSMGAGAQQVSWDGRDGGGAVVSDGAYVIVISAVDGCGRSAHLPVGVEVDTAPPLALVTTPPAGASVTGSLDVRGAAADAHFLAYELAYALDGGAWVPIAQGASAVGSAGQPGLLGRFDTPASGGAAQLRLRVSDRAHNTAEALVALVVTPRARFDRLGVTPALFSPNDDGRRDTATVDYALLDAARVWLDVRTPGGAVVRALVTGVVQAAGSYALGWDGRDDLGAPAPDGEYGVVIRVEDPAGATGAEGSAVAVVVDRAAPQLALDAPQPAQVLPRGDAVIGSVLDQHLAEYTLTATPPGGAATVLATGSQAQSHAPLGGLAALDDGRHTLELSAADAADNRASQPVEFSVDSLPPEAALLQPEPGAVLARVPTPVPVVGTADDANLGEYVLAAGVGAQPAVFDELRRSAVGGRGLELGAWPVQALPDGEYTLRLVVQDLAGQVSEARRTLSVDGTPPQAEIATPAPGAYVNAAGPVSGRARDAHLDEWTLDVAAGAPDVAYQWSPVTSGTQPVDGAVLGAWDPLPPDGAYTLRLSVRDRAGLTAVALRGVTVDTTPPVAPGALHADVVRSGAPRADVRLTWAPSAEPDLAGYRVWRDGQALTPAPVASPEYVDAARPEGRPVYSVVAVDQAGNASAPATLDVAIDLTAPQVDLLRPAPGAVLSGSADVRGTAWSDDFREYRLLVGQGTAPTAWTLIKRSALAVLAGPLGAWNAVADGDYVLALEAEDLAGNVAPRATAGVRVDTQPPSAPTLVSLGPGPAAADLRVEWQSAPESDVLGYLVYRNGRLANATGIVVGDLRPYALPPPAYVATDLPDGEQCFHVVAVDQAGNLSPPSSRLCSTLDTHAPRLVIVAPADGTRFEFPLHVVALTSDTDVASVRFQHKPHSESAWTDFGPPDVQAPWEATLDPAGLAFGAHDLRAVGTDAGGQTDPAPAVVTVTYGDTTAPATPSGVQAGVDGRQVTLAWTPNGEADLEGYHVYRDGERVTTSPLTAAGFEDERDPALYAYAVSAVDQDGNESLPSAAVAARVYQLRLDAPAYPVTAAASAVVSGGGALPGTQVEVLREGAVVAAISTAGARFTLDGLPLMAGANVFVARGRDAGDNLSIPSEPTVLITNTPPDALTGLAAQVDGHDVTLGWDASGASDLQGYAVRRNGDVLTVTSDLHEALSFGASSSAPFLSPSRAFDQNDGTAWLPDPFVNGPHAWTVTFAQAVAVTEVALTFVDESYGSAAPQWYRVEALWEGRYLPVVQATAPPAETLRHVLPALFATTSLRVVFDAPALVGLLEVGVTQTDLPATATYADTGLPDGHQHYEVAAVDRYGAYGPWAGVDAPVGDVEPPGAPQALSGLAEGSDALLSWSANPEGDGVDDYVVLRQGAPIASVVATATAYRDAGRPNGSYAYTVVAVDAAGNASTPSDPALVVIAVQPPEAPLLQGQAAPSGAAFLSWTSPAGAVRYGVRRGSAPGGPFEPLAGVTSNSYSDASAPRGVPQIYQVVAFDAWGNASASSNVVEVTAERTQPPEPPTLAFPTDAAHPVTLATARGPVRGRAEPGTQVTLALAGQLYAAPAGAAFVEHASLELPGAPDAAVLSPGGRRLAYQPVDPDTGAGGLSVIDLARGTVLDASDPRYVSTRPLGFAPDGRRLLYSASGAGGTVGYVLDLDGGSRTLVAFGLSSGAWSPDGEHVAYATWSLGGCELKLWRPEGSSTLDPGPACAFACEFSPDATRLACVFTGGGSQRLHAIVLADGSRTLVSDAVEQGTPSWSPDGERLAFVSGARVAVYDWNGGGTRLVSAADATAQHPRFDPGGRWLSYIETRADGMQRLVAAGDDETRRDVAAFPAGDYVTLHAWTADGYAALLRGPRLSLFAGFDGAFEFPEVSYAPGENLVSVRALDLPSRLESAASEPMRVTAPAELFADLSILPAEILPYPALPVVGQPVVVGARVRNLGAAAAANASARLLILDAGQAPVASVSLTLPLLAPGASQVVSTSFAPAVPGLYRVFVALDDEDAIPEVREDNNTAQRELAAVEGGALAVGLDANLASYPAHMPARVAVSLANGGPPFAGSAVTSVVDAAGAEVARLDERPVALAYGARADYMLDWNSAATYAGSYKFRLDVADAQGTPAAQAERAFAIVPDLRVTARLTPDHASVPFAGAAGFAARVENVGANVPLADLSARLEVVPEGAPAPAATSVTALPAMLPGGLWQAPLRWSPAVPAGRYVATLRVMQGEIARAQASAPFEVRPEGGQALGGLSVAPVDVLAGDTFDVSLSLTNTGTAPLVAYPVAVEVVSGPNATVALRVSLEVDLAPGASWGQTLSLASGALPFGAQAVRLRAGAPETSLARADLRVHGHVAPPSVDAPPTGARVDSPRPTLSVNNASSPDGAALTYDFELYADAALGLPLSFARGVKETPLRTPWRVGPELVEDHTYYWRARADDGFLPSVWTPVAAFTVDAFDLPPAAPEPLSPAGGTVASRQPTLVVRNAVDPEQQPLHYEFRVASDASMASVVASASGLPEGALVTSWTLPAPLDEGGTYFWRGRAVDAQAASPWSATLAFTVDSDDLPPTAPTLLHPGGGSPVASLAPELAASGAQDPEARALTYRFEIDTALSFDSPELQVSPELREAVPETTWVAPLPLRENRLYYWRAAASDGHSRGPWALETFQVNVENEPPPAPVLLEPTDDAAVGTLTPRLRLRNALDPDGDALRYDFVVSDPDGVSVAAASGVPSGDPDTTWIVTPELLEDGRYRWTARADDGVAGGPWSAPAAFRVNVVAAPPGAPGLVAPTEGAVVDTRRPELQVSNAASPEGLPLTYAFEVYAASDGTLVAQAAGVVEGPAVTAWTLPLELADGAYDWRARASDPAQSGAWMATARFSVRVDAPPAPPTSLVAAPGDAQVRLSWDASPEPDVSAYRVYRSLNAGGPYTLAGATAALSLTDTGLTNGVTYHYVVTAGDGVHESGYSSEVAATPAAPPVSLAAEVRFAPAEVASECLIAAACLPHDARRAAPASRGPRFECDDEAELAPGATEGLARGAERSLPCRVRPPAPECPLRLAATLELPVPHDPSGIDLASVRLGASVPADPAWSQIVDTDDDGVPELQVRFDFAAVVPLFWSTGGELSIGGSVAGGEFHGAQLLGATPPRVGAWTLPRALNRAHPPPIVTVVLAVPVCIDEGEIDVASIRFGETVPPQGLLARWNGYLALAFDGGAVAATLPVGEQVEVRVSGRLHGRAFIARDQVRVTDTPYAPAEGGAR